MLQTITETIGEGTALRCRSEVPPEGGFFHGNFRLCNPFMAPQEISSHPSFAFNGDSEDSLHVQRWVYFCVHRKEQLWFYPHGPGEVRSHPFSSFHPSTLSASAIAQVKVAFGTTARGRRTYGSVSPPKPH